jgi:hypothetical protein
LLALVALGLVYRLHPDWLAVDLQKASRQHGQSPERVCRLGGRDEHLFDAVLVDDLTASCEGVYGLHSSSPPSRCSALRWS